MLEKYLVEVIGVHLVHLDANYGSIGFHIGLTVGRVKGLPVDPHAELGAEATLLIYVEVGASIQFVLFEVGVD